MPASTSTRRCSSDTGPQTAAASSPGASAATRTSSCRSACRGRDPVISTARQARGSAALCCPITSGSRSAATIQVTGTAAWRPAFRQASTAVVGSDAGSRQQMASVVGRPDWPIQTPCRAPQAVVRAPAFHPVPNDDLSSRVSPVLEFPHGDRLMRLGRPCGVGNLPGNHGGNQALGRGRFRLHSRNNPVAAQGC